jgi:FkbM family methyltransferase
MFQLRFYPSALSTSLWIDRGDRSDDEQIMSRLLRAGDTMVDVGANIGNMALAAAAGVGPDGRVYAFEPHPRIFRFLQGNIQLNHRANVIPVMCAVGSEDATLTFTDVVSDDMNRISSEGSRRVRQVALDSYLADVPKIRVLKVDVEGYELSVFEGASAVLNRTDYVHFESWEKHSAEFGHSSRDVWKRLWERDFDIWRLCEDRAESLLDLDSQPSDRCENLLAVRKGLPVPR